MLLLFQKTYVKQQSVTQMACGGVEIVQVCCHHMLLDCHHFCKQQEGLGRVPYHSYRSTCIHRPCHRGLLFYNNYRIRCQLSVALPRQVSLNSSKQISPPRPLRLPPLSLPFSILPPASPISLLELSHTSH